MDSLKEQVGIDVGTGGLYVVGGQYFLSIYLGQGITATSFILSDK